MTIIYSRPLYQATPANNTSCQLAWPRTILVEVGRTGDSVWTLIYDNGSHRVINGRAQVELFDTRLTSTNISAYYIFSRKQ